MQNVGKKEPKVVPVVKDAEDRILEALECDRLSGRLEDLAHASRQTEYHHDDDKILEFDVCEMVEDPVTLVAIRRDDVPFHRERNKRENRAGLHALAKVLHAVDLEVSAELLVHERRAKERVGAQTFAEQHKERDEALDHVEDGVHEHVLIHAIALEVLCLVVLALDDESDDEVEDEA